MPRNPRSKVAKAKAKAGTTQVKFVDDIEDMECACESMAHKFYLIYHDEDGRFHAHSNLQALSH